MIRVVVIALLVILVGGFFAWHGELAGGKVDGTVPVPSNPEAAQGSGSVIAAGPAAWRSLIIPAVDPVQAPVRRARPECLRQVLQAAAPLGPMLDQTRPPSLRNEDMAEMIRIDPDQAVAVFQAMMDDETEGEVIRSWGPQHVGTSWAALPESLRSSTRDDLIRRSGNPVMPRLVRRECLLALARLGDHSSRGTIAGHWPRLMNPDDPDLDLLVRLVGLLHIVDHRTTIARWSNHPDIRVRGAVKEAVARIDGDPGGR